ncbi:MAG: ATP-dependent DNA helicase RecG [Candidatus Omnitrophota bacterium]
MRIIYILDPRYSILVENEKQISSIKDRASSIEYRGFMKDYPIRYLKGVGPRKEEVFNKAGVYTLKELLRYFPFRYEDRRNFKKIRDIKAGEFCVFQGQVKVRNLKKMPYFLRSKKIRDIFEVVLDDGTGTIKCGWFNQGYLADSIKVGLKLIVCGKPSFYKDKLQIIAPEYEIVQEEESDSLNLNRIIGIWRLPAVINQRFMRKTVFSALRECHSSCKDPLPFHIRKQKDFFNIVRSFEEMHFPGSWEGVSRARERFIFEELFLSQILVYLRKAKHRSQKGPELKVDKSKLDKIKKRLLFKLTSSQEEVIAQILDDLAKPFPMHRLLQGDVGCGKTVVAVFAIAACVQAGFQAALMVPTEVLAYQHKETLDKILKEKSIKVVTSSLAKTAALSIYKDLKQGKIKIIIGTHSLIQEDIKFKKLGLAVIDEQHKFGVAQRSLLPQKGLVAPHFLVMSATPIPRSLALSLYGDLDLSVIKEMPKQRVPAITTWVKEEKREWVYNFLEEKVQQGRQAYIIYPVIEESKDEELKSLKVMYEKISQKLAPLSIGVFHGKMKNAEKIKVIKDFRENKINILVSTTVIEVGVNIENAAVMIVENPERFGLAQLHQLRGRIQRSNHEPHFILISKDKLSQSAEDRLKVISKQSCGFKIAEEDLKLRGPGDFFGNIQHGLPDLKLANPLRDLEILKQARFFAYQVVKSDPSLEKPQHRCIREYLNI